MSVFRGEKGVRKRNAVDMGGRKRLKKRDAADMGVGVVEGKKEGQEEECIEYGGECGARKEKGLERGNVEVGVVLGKKDDPTEGWCGYWLAVACGKK